MNWGKRQVIRLAAFGALLLEFTLTLLNVALEDRRTAAPLVLCVCLSCRPCHTGAGDQEAERCCLSKVHVPSNRFSPLTQGGAAVVRPRSVPNRMLWTGTRFLLLLVFNCVGKTSPRANFAQETASPVP